MKNGTRREEPLRKMYNIFKRVAKKAYDTTKKAVEGTVKLSGDVMLSKLRNTNVRDPQYAEMYHNLNQHIHNLSEEQQETFLRLRKPQDDSY